MSNYSNEEFLYIISHILDNEEFMKLENIRHHGITRFDHCMRVAYYSYIISKILRLDYQQVTEAALLHDFFTDEVKDKNMIVRLVKHPYIALDNAKKYYRLTPMQEDIIKTHMFPITFIPPKYLESWIVDIIDDISAIYERVACTKKEISAAMSFLFVLLLNYFK